MNEVDEAVRATVTCNRCPMGPACRTLNPTYPTRCQNKHTKQDYLNFGNLQCRHGGRCQRLDAQSYPYGCNFFHIVQDIYEAEYEVAPLSHTECNGYYHVWTPDERFDGYYCEADVSNGVSVTGYRLYVTNSAVREDDPDEEEVEDEGEVLGEEDGSGE